MGLQVQELQKSFGAVRALDGISFNVRNGETFGLLGRNGAGKTTTIRILLKILQKDAGMVLFDDKDISQAKIQLGYLPEERGLYLNYTVRDQILYLAGMYGISARQASNRLRELLDRFGIPEYYNKKVKELSKGNKQKIQLIAAVIHDPQVVILDEPFSGLDPVNIQLFKDFILDLKKQGKTILFSSHRMEDVEEICDHIILLKKGREVLSGSVAEIKKSFSQNLVCLETDREIDALIAAQDFTLVSRQGTRYELQYHTGAQVQRLLDALVKQGISLCHFEFKVPTLHEIFLKELGD